ncbi:serine hydrolase domain-containing protein [Agrococcus baldri]|nr:serine hydrolase domain-containing protein [Agrococcus baldri]
MDVDAELQRIADEAVQRHGVPGVVTGLARPDEASVAVSGARAIGGEPMTRDTVFRIASLTKPVVAAAAMALVDRGTIRLDAPVETWLPELAAPRVLRDPAGPLDDTVPAEGPILVEHLLALRAGLGFAGFEPTPHSAALMERLHQGQPDPPGWPHPDTWMAAAGTMPLLHQPGRGWSYNTGLDLAGVLLSRAAGTSLQEVLADTLLEPLGMRDTGFRLRPEQVARTATAYMPRGAELVETDAPDGMWAGEIGFESGADGLVSSLDDLLALGRMLLAGGEVGGTRVLSSASVARLLRPGEPSSPEHPFLQGQSWSLGGSVDVVELRPWEVRGRYGWIGGSGTAFSVYPRSRTVAVWLTQHGLGAPDDDERLTPPLTLAAGLERAAR